MRVLIDSSYAIHAPFSGTAVYLRMLSNALEAGGQVELVHASAERPRPRGGRVVSARNLLRDEWWTTVELRRLARRAKADVIHHPLPARSETTRIPQVITVHDLSFERLPRCFDRGYRTYAHFTHRLAARSAAAVICVSNTTAADARELWGIRDDRIVIAPHGPGQELPAHHATAKPEHLLYVGDAEPRKDLPTLLGAYAAYREAAADPLPLVLAGSATAQAEGVRIERHPSPDRLSELYAAAATLVHPSLYEGFGLTCLEAMSAGVPVLAAGTPGVAEVCADAAVYAEAGDVAAFAEQMRRLAEDPALRAEIAARGRARAEEFSWSACAEAHVNAYSLAVSSQ